MDLNDARSLATTLMQAHGVGHWNFKFDRAKQRFGLCSYTKQTISISAPLTEVNSEAHVADTILHEIAHALAGPRAGHGPAWKAVARELGASARRTAQGVPVAAEPRYVATCPGCGNKYFKHRKTTVSRSCGRCSGGSFNPAYRLVYLDTRAAVR